MVAYISNRILSILMTLIMVSIITFIVTIILPGDVAVMILGTESNAAMLDVLRRNLGLDDDYHIQYIRWLGNLLQGNWGVSLMFREEIGPLIVSKIFASSLLLLLSMGIALFLSIPLGVLAARYRDKWPDTTATIFSLVGLSMPDFFIGLILILVFASSLGWLPSSGFVDPRQNLMDAVRHALLPAFALGLGLMAHLTRMTRSAMIGVLSQDFVRVARAKGLAESTVVWRYAFPNAVGPVLTVAGLQMGYLFGSIIVIESLFSYTGMGWLTYQALINRDIPLIQCTVLVIAFFVMVVNLVVDILYRFFDPRIGFE